MICEQGVCDREESDRDDADCSVMLCRLLKISPASFQQPVNVCLRNLLRQRLRLFVNP